MSDLELLQELATLEKRINALDQKIIEKEAHMLTLINSVKDPILKKIMMNDFLERLAKADREDIT
jgi:hypothetical protein